MKSDPTALAQRADTDTEAVALRSVWKWLIVWLAAAIAIITLAFIDGVLGYLASSTNQPSLFRHSTLVVVLLALGCEFVDATIGMGYGTTLTPVLMILGFPLQAIIPAAVLSQLAGNVSAAYFHHQVGNIDFLRDHRSRNVALVMGGAGLVMAVATVLVSVRVPAAVLKPMVASIVAALGLFVLISSRLQIPFRWRNVTGLAALAGFNKAFTGGGYGPLVCGGQVLVGLDLKSSVAATALAEAIVCLATVTTYLFAGIRLPVELLLPLAAGALLSTPVSALALQRLPAPLIRKLMGAAILTLGILSLAKVTTGV